MADMVQPDTNSLQIPGEDLSAPSSPATARNDCSITPLTPSSSPRVEVRPRMACPFSVVVAIDFGTTSSGYAFSFTQDSDAIHMMKRWEGGDPGVANQKSPTCLLLTPELRFHSFGFAARDFYHDLDPEEARHWLYFDKFKMKIHSTSDLTMETELEAVNGRKVRAIEVFAHALRFFREHALKEVKDQSSSVLEGEEIRWVITVPAVWRQPAKQFMREAAYLTVSEGAAEAIQTQQNLPGGERNRRPVVGAADCMNIVKWSSQGMLRLTQEAMNELFQPTIVNIVKHIEELMVKPEVRGVRFLFLVGGFAESPMLQKAVQKAFGRTCRIIIPHDVGLTILKGAVLFGLDPTVVRVRRCPLTYGVGVLNRFVEGRHPRDKLLIKEGREWCTDILDRFVCLDQSVALGEVVRRSYTPARLGQRKIIINIYCSATDDITYISDPGVRKCGTITLDLPEPLPLPGAVGGAGAGGQERREIRASMQFGDTEIKVTAADVMSNRSVRASIDFLSN
nr:PREDICTED: heat shock 70 kDa protein 12B-like [Paralichthys olivaceus]